MEFKSDIEAQPRTTPSFVAVGECMLELTRSTNGWQMAFGGDTYNTAVYLARMGCNVAYMTAIGNDPFSAEMRAQFERESLDTSFVLTNETRLPGLYAIRTDQAGERSFFYWREQAAVRTLLALPAAEQLCERAAAADVLYLSGITLSLFDAAGRDRLARVARAIRAAGGTVAFDPNYRAKGWRDAAEARTAIQEFAQHVTMALPTYDDEAVLHGDVDPSATMKRWRDHGADDVAVKLGPGGCLIAMGDHFEQIAPQAHIRAVDTTGAGDSFNAAYLAARCGGADVITAATAANKLAAQVICYPGAIMPRDVMAQTAPAQA